MFDLNVRLQAAALLFVTVILIDFFRSKKIPTKANRNFQVMLMLTVVNLIFDITTVYTITHMDTVPETFNIIAHKALYISIAAVVQSFYKYVCALDCDKGTENKIFTYLKDLPFAAAAISALVFDVWFYCDGEKHAYSQGSAVITTFLFVGIQLAIIIYTTIKIRIPRSSKIMILSGIAVWITICVIQYFVPYMLLTGLGISIMMAFVYLSFENPAEYVDHETGCYNRFALDCVLREKMHSAKSFVIINVVMDELSMVISRFGYGAGHALMTELGEFLSGLADRRVYIFRDNSFVIFVNSRSRAEDICGSISSRLEKMWEVKDTLISVKSHADVLEFPDFAHNYDEVNDTLKYASDHAEQDKTINFIGESCVSGYKRETEILYLLRDAVKTDGFDVFYQPIYCASERKFSSAEALVRMKNCGTLGYISPEEFIPIAEKNGLIMSIGRLVLRKVCAFAKEHSLTELGIKYIEVNISGVQIVNNELPDIIGDVLEEYKVKPQFINLEITETAAVNSAEQMKINLRKIKNGGCSFSLDDFGTGYSNLSKVADSSFDLIKLDKSLIWPCFDESAGVGSSYKARVILCNVISMIRQLHMNIVAEGVETKEQADELISRGVNYLQGYYYSKPLSEEDFIKFIT